MNDIKQQNCENTDGESRQVEQIVSPLIIHKRKADVLRVKDTLLYIARTSIKGDIEECLWRIRSIIGKKYNVSFYNNIVTVELNGEIIFNLLIAG